MNGEHRTWKLLALLAIALLITACGPDSCSNTIFQRIVPYGPTIKPGETRTFTVYTTTNDTTARDEETHPAGGVWVWTVAGSGVSQPVKKSNDSCVWTAPKTEGDYVIHAVGKTPKAEKPEELNTVVHVRTSAGTPQEQSQEKPAAAPATPEKILDVGNVYGIKAGAKAPSFTLAKPAVITSIQTYHFLEGGGPAPGTIGLKAADGTVYGPWPCKGVDGQGAVKNAFWVAAPMADVPAGTYTIVDSNPATWSTNDRAKGLGFTTVFAAYK
jgi:hypothetical protein